MEIEVMSGAFKGVVISFLPINRHRIFNRSKLGGLTAAVAAKL